MYGWDLNGKHKFVWVSFCECNGMPLNWGRFCKENMQLRTVYLNPEIHICPGRHIYLFTQMFPIFPKWRSLPDQNITRPNKAKPTFLILLHSASYNMFQSCRYLSISSNFFESFNTPSEQQLPQLQFLRSTLAIFAQYYHMPSLTWFQTRVISVRAKYGKHILAKYRGALHLLGLLLNLPIQLRHVE